MDDAQEVKQLIPKEAPKLYQRPANQLIAQVRVEPSKRRIEPSAVWKKPCWIARRKFRSTPNC
jgi:hypothetical protein